MVKDAETSQEKTGRSQEDLEQTEQEQAADLRQEDSLPSAPLLIQCVTCMSLCPSAIVPTAIVR